MFGTHPHFMQASGVFTIKHYAGNVMYTVEGFSERNRDTLSADLVQLMQQSTRPFLAALFAAEELAPGAGGERDARQARARNPTAGSRIRVRLQLCFFFFFESRILHHYLSL